MGDRLLITPTGVRLSDLRVDELSVTDLEGRHLGGPRPSKELAVHVGMLRARPGAGAVVHLHSSHAVAVACRADLDPHDALPPFTAYSVMRLGRVALVPYLPPGDPGLGSAVEAAARETGALLLANHGLVTSGRDLDAAMGAAEEIEETARIWLLLGDVRGRVLSVDDIAELQRRGLVGS